MARELRRERCRCVELKMREVMVVPGKEGRIRIISAFGSKNSHGTVLQQRGYGTFKSSTNTNESEEIQHLSTREGFIVLKFEKSFPAYFKTCTSCSSFLNKFYN